MAFLGSRRSLMTLYTNKLCPSCHRVRVVLSEKGISADMVEIDPNHPQEDLYELNPYGTVPMLVDRDLVLYESSVILEYLEERFPHPPLMPVYPVSRARSRLMMLRIDRDWYTLAMKIIKGTESEQKVARRELYDSLLSVAPVFAETAFFLSEEFSLVDCSLAALLWRLPALGVDLPKVEAKAIIDYANRLFKREAFLASLSDAEREMRPRYYS
ncbi:MAG: glutathione S-transferase N-terminal domain-containing protein [Gammaproteobacteria bacterium]|jgi:RNA polymerase-associated protein|nr:glutathione S-transferase N-terminal domain-containing protein [Gammaproteobacteria bacterium]